MLNSVLDAKITERIVRLGSQSTDERIREYSLRNLEQTFDDTSMNRQIRREYAVMKKIEEEMYRVMTDIQIPDPSEDQIKEYLQTNWEDHLSAMYDPPFWIAEYAARLWESEGEESEWKVQGKKGKGKEQSQLMARTYYGLWKRGLDIAFIQPPQAHSIPTTTGPPKGQKKRGKRGGQNVQPSVMLVQPTQQEQEMYRKRMFEFFFELGFDDSVPPVPAGNRPFVALQDSSAVWGMSLEERRRLADHWEEEMRRLAYDNYLEEYKSLRVRYDEVCETYDSVSDEVRVYCVLNRIPANCPCRGNAVY